MYPWLRVKEEAERGDKKVEKEQGAILHGLFFDL